MSSHDVGRCGPGWPLVGRDEEIQAIESAFRRAGTSGVVLTGGRGVGKSRVAAEAAQRLEAGGCRVVRVDARRALSGTPYGAIAHFVPGENTQASVLSRLISRLKTANVGAGRVAVVLDDLHLLDEASAAVIAELAARRFVFVIGTVALGGHVPEAFTPLWSGGRLLTVPIRPMPAEAMDRLIATLPGVRRDAVARRRLAKVTGRNPLALQALVEMLPGQGLAGRWLAEAGPAVRAVVEVVACADPMPVWLLEKLMLPEAIDAAEQAGMVRIGNAAGSSGDDGGTGALVRVAPPLSAPLVRCLLTTSALQRIYRTLVAALLSEPLDRDGILRAGEWQLRAAMTIRPDCFLPAAREALRRWELPMAAELAQAAREQCPEFAADLLYCRVLSLQGENQRALDAMPNQPSDGTEQAAQWAELAAEIRYFGLGQPGFVAERILDGVVGGQDAHRAAGLRAWIHLAEGRSWEALSAARGTLTASASDSGARARVWAAEAGTAAAALAGRVALGKALEADGLSTGETSPTWATAQRGYGACLARLFSGDLASAQQLSDQGFEDAVAAGAKPIAGIWAALRASVAKARGQVRTACSLLEEALLLLPREGWGGLRTLCATELAGVSAMTGGSAFAGEWLTRTNRSAAVHAMFEPWVELNRAWAFSGVGDLARAVEACHRAAVLAADCGFLALEASALYDVARLGAANAVYRRLAELTHLVEGDTVRVMASAAKGLACRDEEALVRAAEAFDKLGYRLLAAETATAASYARRLHGRQASAAVLHERAEALAAGCEGARTPLLDRWRLHAQLTPREREVVLLAPTSTTPQIAARLGLSPRTVSNYLQRAYDKLGLTGRADLRVFLGYRLSGAEIGPADC